MRTNESETILRLIVATGLLYGIVTPAAAFNLEFDFGGESFTLRSLNTVSLGAAWRVEERDDALVGKANLEENRTLCAPDDCIALSRDNTEPNERFLAAPGGLSSNIDDGNLNYDKGDLIALTGKWSVRNQLEWGWGGLELDFLYYYDTVNTGFRETHPNEIVTPGPQPGQRVRADRADESEDEVGNDFQFRNFNIRFDIPLRFWDDRELELTIGRQQVNWGEATIQLQGLNFINPPSLNNLARPGIEFWEIYTPVGLVHGDLQINENMGLEAFYQYEWRPVGLPPRGSYFSFLDAGGTLRDGDHFPALFGKHPQDPNQLMQLADPVARGVSDTSLSILRASNIEPPDGGQYGLNFRWYLPDLGPQGTQFNFIYSNYHARIPNASAIAADATCARREGNPNNRDSANAAEFVIDCQPDLPFILTAVGEQNGFPVGSLPVGADTEANPGRDALPVDTARVALEYPRDIQLYGLTFNTVALDLTWQGELAYRPNLPVQVDLEDVLFAALQPVFPRNEIDITEGIVSAFPGGAGALPFTIPAATLTDSRTAIPDFLTAYRGGTPGEVAPGSFIRGYERLDTWSGSLTVTKVMGQRSFFGADQLALLGELGWIYITDLPDEDELQFEGPGTNTHASPGIAETGNALKINPIQTTDGFVTDLSYGYTLALLSLYQNVIWDGFDLRPLIVFRHDVKGVAPGLAENFLEGRKFAVPTLEFNYGNWSGTMLYSAFFGGGDNNTINDRDLVSVWLTYDF